MRGSQRATVRKVEPSPYSASIDITVDVSWTGDLPVRYLDRPGAKIEKKAHAQIAGVERPAFERHDLPTERVAARVWKKPKGPPGVGFVTNLSVTGMSIDTDTSFPLRTQIQVELVVPGGYSAVLPGRVIRANDKGMAIHLETDDSTWQFRSSFLELARRAEGQAPSVILRKGEIVVDEEVAPGHHEADDFRVLGAKWHEVLASLDDDAIHQEFIQECLRRQRLEFGLERYRELKDGPDDAVAARYLGQIGVILGFMSLKKQPTEDREKRTRTLKVLLLCLTVLAALFLAKTLFMTKAGIVDTPPPAELAPRIEVPPESPPPPPSDPPSSEWDLPRSPPAPEPAPE